MKISLVVVSETYDEAVKSQLADYSKRLNHYISFDIVTTSEEKLEKALEKYDRIFLLDELGKEYTSAGFADMVQKQLNAGGKSICFVIGGAYGFTQELRAKAQGTIALSKLTFPHQLVRTIFAEQLYRAFTILNNEKYHH